ncbi:ABC transporter permease [Phycicoccus sp. BSK3Z-2]|uniref:ABC transporter permease n=1 Tax=Phycicoccus avicenniae TaxID=2828860 RepID=A0A941DDC6_9MICO|nr:ABC transporter permease [Phycicoccus avicenniae]MBR7744252.1 ABC transporter permease [Phycicoccus avicenniae]
MSAQAGTDALTGGSTDGPTPTPRPGRGHAWRRAFLTPAGVVGLVLMALVLLLAGMAVTGLTASPSAQDVGRSLLGPGAQGWFGTDQFGRDVFARVASGLANSLRVAVVSVAVSGVVGISLGVLAGYYRGWADRLVGIVNNVLFAFPSLLLALALAATLERSWVTVSVAIAVVYVPIFARVARAPVLGLREAEYVVASDAIGRSRLSTLVRHVVPNMTGILVVQTTLSLSWAILTEASLSFLGFGTPPPAASLGGMVYEAQTLAVIAPWMLAFPGIALVVVVVALNLLGDALRSALDPRSGGR